MTPLPVQPHVQQLIDDYRHLIYPGQRGDLERLYRGETSYQINAPLAFVEMGVQASVDLLRRLAVAGLLRSPNDPEAQRIGEAWQSRIDQAKASIDD